MRLIAAWVPDWSLRKPRLGPPGDLRIHRGLLQQSTSPRVLGYQTPSQYETAFNRVIEIEINSPQSLDVAPEGFCAQAAFYKS
jgi:hypothetical protein